MARQRQHPSLQRLFNSGVVRHLLKESSAYIGLLFFIFANAPCKAQQFHAQGLLTTKVLGTKGAVRQETAESFEVYVNDCKWLIKARPYPNPEAAAIGSWQVGSEGSNGIYQISLINNPSPRSVNDSTGAVESGEIPENIQGAQVSEIWLAFASSCYLDTVTNGLLAPVYNLEDESLRAKGYFVHAQYKRSPESPRLPVELTYIEDKRIGMQGEKVVFAPLPPEFKTGFPRAQYEVLATTNMGGLVLPTEFVFKESFLLNNQNHKLQLFTTRIVHGAVSNLVPTCEITNVRPNLTRTTYIADERFNREEKPVESLPYLVTNQAWVNTNSTELQNMYKSEMNVRRQIISTNAPSMQIPTGDKKERRRWIMAALFILIIFLGFLFQQLCRNRRKKTI